MISRNHTVAVVLGLAVALAVLVLIATLDRTNLGTTNGLWKSDDVYQWEHSTGTPIDTGNVLYLPVYGYLCRLIPDDWARLGSVSSVVTFRKMALLNALFAGLAAALVFLVSRRFLNTGLAAAVTLLHATTAFVLLCSINSEDIMPSYAVLMAAILCFVHSLGAPPGSWSRNIALLALPLLTVGAMLLHWTQMAPAFAAFGAAELYLAWRGTLNWRWVIAQVVIFFTTVAACHWFLPFDISIAEYLYPGKAKSGWVGFVPMKVMSAVVGIGNYFSGGANTNYPSAFYRTELVPAMFISWVVTLASLAQCLWTATRKKIDPALEAFAVFALVVFAVGQLANLYGQPYDPQTQLEPMLVVPAGLILALASLGPKWTARSTTLAVTLSTLALANGASNLRLMMPTAPTDESSIAGNQEMVNQFPYQDNFYVSSGWDGWITWAFVLNFPGRRNDFEAENAFLYSPFTNHRGITVDQAVDEMRNRIDAQFAAGQRVVASSLWQEPKERFVVGLATLIGTPRAQEYTDKLAALYTPGRSWKLINNTFVQLHKAPGR